MHSYKHAVATLLKRFLESSRFQHSIRFGWETEPTGPGSETVIIFKIDTYGGVMSAHPSTLCPLWDHIDGISHIPPSDIYPHYLNNDGVTDY